VRSALQEAHGAKRLPYWLHLLASLPIPAPDPRDVARAHWSGFVRLRPAG
jgi:hypothetical protein